MRNVTRERFVEWLHDNPELESRKTTVGGVIVTRFFRESEFVGTTVDMPGSDVGDVTYNIRE